MTIQSEILLILNTTEPANQPTFKSAAAMSSSNLPGYLLEFYGNEAWKVLYQRSINILELTIQPTLSPPQQYQAVIYPVICSISTTKKRGNSPTRDQKPGNTFNPGQRFTR